jgi:hypothetical protein
MRGSIPASGIAATVGSPIRAGIPGGHARLRWRVGQRLVSARTALAQMWIVSCSLIMNCRVGERVCEQDED